MSGGRSRARRAGAALAVALAASSIGTLAPPLVGATQSVAVVRFAGGNRYATAAAVATGIYQPAGTPGALGTRPRPDVILASGEDFPDGLTAAGLAGALDAPILLTARDQLPGDTVAALATLGAVRVHVIGGTSAVSQTVRNQLSTLGYTLVQTYSGANRYDTAARVASAIGAGNVGSIGGRRTAIVAVGTSFADALAAGAPAASHRLPLLLSVGSGLSPEAANALSALGIQHVVIMGGASALSGAVQNAIEARGITTRRLGGSDRADTARLLANLLVTSTSSGGFGYPNDAVVLFNGFDGFADGLTAGPLAGKGRDVLLPVDDSGLPSATTSFLTVNRATLSRLSVVGGTSAISEATATAARTAATTNAPTATFAAAQGATSFTITFSESMQTATISAADFAISSTAPVEAVTGVSVVANTDRRTFRVTLNGTLDAGDVVTLLDGFPVDGLAEVTTSSGVKALATSAAVGTDSVGPVVTITAQGGQAFSLTFSEPVTPALVGGSLAASNVDERLLLAQGTGATLPSYGTNITVSTGAVTLIQWNGLGLVAGNTVTVLAGSFLDAAGNPNAGTTVVAGGDGVNPSLSSAQLVTSHNGVDALVVGTAPNQLSVTADAPGDSGLSLRLQSGTPQAVSYNSTTRLITVTLGAAGNRSAPALAAAINGHGTVSALVTASGGGAADLAPVATTALAGGTTSQSVTVNFTEAVVVPASSLIVDLDGSLGTVGDRLFVPTSNATAPTGTLSVPVQPPAPMVPGGSVLIGSSTVTDLSGNPLGGATVFIT